MEEYINEETIIEDEFYKKFKESVICPLCLNILINPLMCIKCQNVYCKKCIDMWSKKDDKCPNRCIEPNFQRSLAKNEILSTLKFKCKECGKNIYYDDAKKHHDSCCPDTISNDINIIWDYVTPTPSNETKKPQIEKIGKEEIEQLKKEGKEIIHITGKKIYPNKLQLFFIYSNYIRNFNSWENKFNRNVNIFLYI